MLILIFVFPLLWLFSFFTVDLEEKKKSHQSLVIAVLVGFMSSVFLIYEKSIYIKCDSVALKHT